MDLVTGPSLNEIQSHQNLELSEFKAQQCHLNLSPRLSLHAALNLQIRFKRAFDKITYFQGKGKKGQIPVSVHCPWGPNPQWECVNVSCSREMLSSRSFECPMSQGFFKTDKFRRFFFAIKSQWHIGKVSIIFNANVNSPFKPKLIERRPEIFPPSLPASSPQHSFLISFIFQARPSGMETDLFWGTQTLSGSTFHFQIGRHWWSWSLHIF